MKKRKLTAEEIAHSEARLARLRARERELRAVAEAQRQASAARRSGWLGRLGLR